MGTNPYESPKTQAEAAGPKRSTYGRAIVFALVQQAFLLLLAASMLDGGYLLRACVWALIVSWAVSLAVMLRHWNHPTAFDLAAVKYGFWFAVVLLLFAGPLIGFPVFG
jgi:hypothetical protein